MKNLFAGVQMYTLRDYCKTPEDVAKTLPKVRKMGYHFIQVSAMAKMDAGELRKLLDDNELAACSMHVGYPDIAHDLNRVIEEHLILGCEAIQCPGLPAELHNGAGYRTAAKLFAKVLPKIKKNGLMLGYHNHAIELQRYGGKTGLEILFSGCPELHAEIDTYWIQHGGGDPAAWIERCSGRVSQIHVKDMGVVDNKQVMPPIGEGNLNWDRILPAARKAGVKFLLVEMDSPTLDPLEAVKKSLQNLKRMGVRAE